MINILLVDDQALLCEVLKTWLDVEEDLIVAGVAHDGQEAIAKVEELRPDIVLMDIDMPKMDGLNATKIICQRFPEVKVIVLSGHDDDDYLGRSLESGAKGYLLKNTTAEELVLKIRSIYNNVSLPESMSDNTSLQPVQAKLEELLEAYRHKFQSQIEKYEASFSSSDYLRQLEQTFEQRLQALETTFAQHQAHKISEIEYKNQSSWESIRKELINVNNQFNQANRNLSSQFERQISSLKQDLDSQVTNALDDWSRQRAALQEWAVQRDEMRPSIEEYESKSRHELMSVINPIKSSFGDVDKQIKKMRTLTIISSIIAISALSLSVYLIFSRSTPSSSLVPLNNKIAQYDRF